MPMSRRALAALLTLVLLPVLAYGLILALAARPAESQNVPVLASPNVEFKATVPGTVAISGVFSRSAPYFYVSGVDSLSVIDVSDPTAPKLVGKLQDAIFENEAMTLGERVVNGKIQRFVLIGVDYVQASASIADRSHVGGKRLVVVDVTDPTAPKIIGITPDTGPGAATTSTHTVACMDPACATAYSAGTAGKFSIFDLTDLTKPVQVGTAASPAAGPNAAFANGAGHHWNVDGAGIAFHAGSGGTAAFDISDPRAPKALQATDPNGTKTPYNDFIHHNVQRPNARAFSPGRPPSVVNGNVALITEEDYLQDGQQLACDKAGTFQTWEIKDLDGAAYRAGNPKLEPNKGSMTPLDIINPPSEAGGGLSSPAGGFCSAHWFDYHQSGIVAEGYYQQGLRLIDTRNPRDLKQFGFFTAGGSEVWDAYWAPQRNPDGTAIPGKKSNIVYTVDAARGVDVFEVTNLPPDLPVSGDDGSRGAFPAPPETVAQATAPGTSDPGSGPGTAPGGPAPGGASAMSRPCGLPTSRIAKGSGLTRKALRLRGTARGDGCGITRVLVSIARVQGSGRRSCRFLRADGSFGAARDCDRTSYLPARGREAWSLTTKVKLPRGRYLIWSRAYDAAGHVERKARVRNHLATRLG